MLGLGIITGGHRHQGHSLFPQDIGQFHALIMHPGGMPPHTANNIPIDNTEKPMQVDQNAPPFMIKACLVPDLDGQIDIRRHSLPRDEQGDDIILS